MKKENFFLKNLSLISLSIILLFFLVFYISKNNSEFILYIIVLYILITIIYFLNKNYNFSAQVLWGFSLWGLLHMLGGSLTVGSKRLYDLMLLNLLAEPYYILKFDQFVHFYCYVILSMIIYEILIKNFKKKDWLVLSFIILASLGIGAINEIIEFGAVVFLGNTGVGNYYNTSLDLVFNFIGASLGVLIASRTKKE